jgi:hypothetical protein
VGRAVLLCTVLCVYVDRVLPWTFTVHVHTHTVRVYVLWVSPVIIRHVHDSVHMYSTVLRMYRLYLHICESLYCFRRMLWTMVLMHVLLRNLCTALEQCFGATLYSIVLWVVANGKKSPVLQWQNVVKLYRYISTEVWVQSYCTVEESLYCLYSCDSI